MKTYTEHEIISCGYFGDYSLTAEVLKGRKRLTAVEILQLDIPFEDAMRLLYRLHVLSKQICVAFSNDCVNRARDIAAAVPTVATAMEATHAVRSLRFLDACPHNAMISASAAAVRAARAAASTDKDIAEGCERERKRRKLIEIIEKEKDE